jgi:hypothetical protein
MCLFCVLFQKNKYGYKMCITFQTARLAVENSESGKKIFKKSRNDSNNKSDLNLDFVLDGLDDRRATRSRKKYPVPQANQDIIQQPLSLRRIKPPAIAAVQTQANGHNQQERQRVPTHDDLEATNLLLSLSNDEAKAVVQNTTRQIMLTEKVRLLSAILAINNELNDDNTFVARELEKTARELLINQPGFQDL